jgi:glycerol-3-phosphate acyltransferase PlsY
VFDSSTVLALCCAGAFLLGSIPPGLFIAKARGVDIRQVGSGNIGTTNVLRNVGKTEAAITLTFDIAKGLLPVLLIGPFFSLLDMTIPTLSIFAPYTANALLVAQGLVGLSAILGHNFSIFLAFKGGKGVASSIGVVFALAPHVGLMTVTIWMFTFSKTKISSMGALAAFGALPFIMYFYDKSIEKTAIVVLISALLYIRHIPNIKRLIDGTEGKFVKK